MATVAVQDTTELSGDQCVVMHGIGWDGYTKVLRARGERSIPRMVYLDGDLYLTSPAYRHESLAERLGYFVITVAEECDVPCTFAGSTTFRRKKKKGGVEGDKTFYLANEPRIRGKAKLQLRTDPPPDLVIEAVNTHDADEAVEVWRRFGVPEVWVEDGDHLAILSLQADGQYAKGESSVAFPFLTTAEIHEWVTLPSTASEIAWLKAPRKWVVETLLPRAKSFPKTDESR